MTLKGRIENGAVVLDEPAPLPNGTPVRVDIIENGRDPLNIRNRIGELKRLESGWLDGKGIPLNADGLDWIGDSFEHSYPAVLPKPYLFPTPEGQLLVEWSLKPWSPSLEVNLVTKTGRWHALNVDTDEEQFRDLDLKDSSNWNWLAEQIRVLGGPAR